MSRLAAALMTAALLAACSAGGSDLDSTTWTLVSIDGASLLAGSHISLEFRDGNAGGNSGCNAYGGPYTARRGGSLSIAGLSMTDMACMDPEGVMEQESVYLDALTRAAAYRIDGDRLEITGGPVLVFVRQPQFDTDPASLTGTSWRLTSLNGSPPAAGSTLTLTFEPVISSEGTSQATGSAGCRDYVSEYQAEGDRISFLSIAMQGDPPCMTDAALMEQEGRFTDALTWARQVRLGDGSLEIITSRGESLVFEAVQ
jgi:heat shock protein HslJ